MFQNFFTTLFLFVTVLFPLCQCKTSAEQQDCLEKAGRWEVGVCDQCMTGDQCGVYEGTAMFCCPYMKKCVPSSSHGCSSQHGPYGSCIPTCFDYDFPFDCPGCTEAFPEQWPGYECYAGTAATNPPTTKPPTTKAPTTKAPTTKAPTTKAPTTNEPTRAPISVGTASPTKNPTPNPTASPTTKAPTTKAPTIPAPTVYVDPCSMVNCGIYGICAVSMKGAGICICKGGWSGYNCEVPPMATCVDGVKNGDEVQVDCGGEECHACQGPNWVNGEWVTTCEPKCTMSRDVKCVEPGGNTTDDQVCLDYGLHPVKRTMNCSDTEKAVACVTPVNVSNPGDYRWMTCGWDECTATCGGLVGMIGMQHRLIFCLDMKGEVVSAAMCQAESRPKTILVGCGQTQCKDFNWMADSAWSSCEDGARKRSFHCHAKDGTNRPNADCMGVTQPEKTQQCNLNSCPPPTPSILGLGNNNGGYNGLHISWLITAILTSLLCLL